MKKKINFMSGVSKITPLPLTVLLFIVFQLQVFSPDTIKNIHVSYMNKHSFTI
jgi:hypothetical protein